MLDRGCCVSLDFLQFKDNGVYPLIVDTFILKLAPRIVNKINQGKYWIGVSPIKYYLPKIKLDSVVVNKISSRSAVELASL